MMADKPQAKWKDVSFMELSEAIKKLSNWKAPGIDQAQNFWLKYLTALYLMMLDLFNANIKNLKDAPLWLTCGQAIPIHKKGGTSNTKYYRPITCLSIY